MKAFRNRIQICQDYNRNKTVGTMSSEQWKQKQLKIYRSLGYLSVGEQYQKNDEKNQKNDEVESFINLI